jgi:serine protease Do
MLDVSILGAVQLAKRLAVAALACAIGLTTAHAQTQSQSDVDALVRAADAVVGVRVEAVEDAGSAATLGTLRQGSGVVIGDDGLVLTIGYLVLEADQVLLLTDDGRKLPARVLAYDLATGFALLQSLAPLKIAPVALGQSSKIGASDPLLMASGMQDGRAGVVGQARLATQRAFAGYWEYWIADALFVTPARDAHSGAGLFNQRGELVGIGSLFVHDVWNRQGSEQTREPGHMFVPVDLLRPILAELRRNGRSAASKRAWLGVSCVEQSGRLRVVRVSDDSPAKNAGVRAGDVVRAIDGQAVFTLESLWKRLWQGAVEREVTLELERDAAPLQLKLRSIDRQEVIKRPSGV